VDLIGAKVLKPGLHTVGNIRTIVAQNIIGVYKVLLKSVGEGRILGLHFFRIHNHNDFELVVDVDCFGLVSKGYLAPLLVWPL